MSCHDFCFPFPQGGGATVVEDGGGATCGGTQGPLPFAVAGVVFEDTVAAFARAGVGSDGGALVVAPLNPPPFVRYFPVPFFGVSSLSSGVSLSLLVSGGSRKSFFRISSHFSGRRSPVHSLGSPFFCYSIVIRCTHGWRRSISASLSPLSAQYCLCVPWLGS